MLDATTIPWGEVNAVAIRTTAEGPWAEDVFWCFLIGDRIAEIPQAAVDDGFVAELHARLRGVDSEQIIRAMTSVEERIFYVWPYGSEELEGRFAAVVTRLGGAFASAAFARLIAAWSEPQRRYHSVAHLRDCLRELDASESSDRDLVELALWYHDAIYKPGASDNEERSAEMLLTDCTELGIAAPLAARAAELVRSTTHALCAQTDAERLLLDIDLSILGSDALRFMAYEYGVEEEYRFIPTREFRIARRRFLASLLGRPYLFHTARFRARYEKRAREQLAALLRGPRYRADWLRAVARVLRRR
jgi:predicted metal-dependent HD superfamily phosphohydrolase